MHTTFFPDFPRIDLGGEWRLDGLDEQGAPLSCPAAVPGDVHGALLAAGRMPDPFWGRNEERVQWVAKGDWTFSRTFDVPEAFLRHASVILRLEDCELCDCGLPVFHQVTPNDAKASVADALCQLA